MRPIEELMREALESIKHHAGAATTFTRRLQYIRARASSALLGEEWDQRWQAGPQTRIDVFRDNEQLKRELDTLTEANNNLRNAHAHITTKYRRAIAEIKRLKGIQ